MITKITYGQCSKANLQLEELIDIIDDSAPLDSPFANEFLKVSDIVEECESIHYIMEKLK